MQSHQIPIVPCFNNKSMLRDIKCTWKLIRLFDVYLEWCKLTGRVVQQRGFEAFVLGQPVTYWLP